MNADLKQEKYSAVHGINRTYNFTGKKNSYWSQRILVSLMLLSAHVGQHDLPRHQLVDQVLEVQQADMEHREVCRAYLGTQLALG